MNLAGIDAIIKSLQDKNLRKAMAHPEWEEAYEAIVGNMEEYSKLDDSTPQGQFLEVISAVSFSVSDGVLCAEESGMDPYEWKDGKWDNEGEEDDDE